PGSPAAPQVRDLVAIIERRDLNPPSSSKNAFTAPLHLADDDPVLVATGSGFSIKSWEPPGIDEVKPLVAANATCPYENVVDRVGERTKQFIDDLVRFSAIEDMLHEELNELGKPITRVRRKFDYVASISSVPGFLSIDEYRSEKSGAEAFPDHIATRGLPTLAFVFHPDMRAYFQITCEGLGQWNGRATWLLH